jgi:hypothetical protein
VDLQRKTFLSSESSNDKIFSNVTTTRIAADFFLVLLWPTASNMYYIITQGFFRLGVLYVVCVDKNLPDFCVCSQVNFNMILSYNITHFLSKECIVDALSDHEIYHSN